MSVFARAAALSGLRRYAGKLLGALCWRTTPPFSDAKLAVFRPMTQGSRSGTRFFSSDDSQAVGEEVEDAAAVERYRAAKNFKRRIDGRVLLFGKDSASWMEAKLDGYVEGSLLLRGHGGLLYYLVSEDLKQIDLSSDQLVGTLFGEGGWERLMQPLYTQTNEGDLKHVRMTPMQFRSIFTVLRESPALQEGQ